MMFSIHMTIGAVMSLHEVTDLRRLSHLLHALEYILMARSRSSSPDSSWKPTNRKASHACGMNTSCSPRPIKGFPAQCTWVRHAPYTVRTIEKKGRSKRPIDLISRIPTLYSETKFLFISPIFFFLFLLSCRFHPPARKPSHTQRKVGWRLNENLDVSPWFSRGVRMTEVFDDACFLTSFCRCQPEYKCVCCLLFNYCCNSNATCNLKVFAETLVFRHTRNYI